MTPEPGRLAWPYPVDHCANEACEKPLNEGDAAYLFCVTETGRLCVLCDLCCFAAELHDGLRFRRVEL